MVEYFICYEPEEKLFSKIDNAKQFIYKNFGNQTYLLDPPHLTLFVAKTDDLENIIEKIKFYFDNKKKQEIEITDWLLFPKDKITNKTTIALKLSDKSIKSLQTEQFSLLNYIKLFNSKDYPKRYKCVKSFSEIEKQNLSSYGFPFVGDIWLPHLSLCSIDDSKIEIIKANNDINSFINKYSLSKIAVYELIDDNPLEKIKLNLK